jgi:hypothetical protein
MSMDRKLYLHNITQKEKFKSCYWILVAKWEEIPEISGRANTFLVAAIMASTRLEKQGNRDARGRLNLINTVEKIQVYKQNWGNLLERKLKRCLSKMVIHVADHSGWWKQWCRDQDQFLIHRNRLSWPEPHKVHDDDDNVFPFFDRRSFTFVDDHKFSQN